MFSFVFPQEVLRDQAIQAGLVTPEAAIPVKAGTPANTQDRADTQALIPQAILKEADIHEVATLTATILTDRTHDTATTVATLSPTS